MTRCTPAVASIRRNHTANLLWLNWGSVEVKSGPEKKSVSFVEFRDVMTEPLSLVPPLACLWGLPREDPTINSTASPLGLRKGEGEQKTPWSKTECHRCFIYMRHHLFYKLGYCFKWNTQGNIYKHQGKLSTASLFHLERGRFPNQTGFDFWKERR